MINRLVFSCLGFFQSNYLYTDNARKMRDKYQVVLDTPEHRKVQELKTHLSEVKTLNILQRNHSSSDHFSDNYASQKLPPLPLITG